MKINVQFSDSSASQVVSYFGSPQDPTQYPNQAEIDTTDARWKSYYDALPAPFQVVVPEPTSD